MKTTSISAVLSPEQIAAAWRSPAKAAATMTPEQQRSIPQNPAGNVTDVARFAQVSDHPSPHFTIDCFSSQCYSSQCFSNVCHTADCFTGQNQCGYTTSC